MAHTQDTDVVIVGGGISGAALAYLLARYTDIPRITLLEKYAGIATLNSHGRNNSQTLHCGDIETNYTLEKALQVQQGAALVARYALQHPARDELIFKYPKMVLGVGEKESALMRERFRSFSPHYPTMRLFEATDIARIEPEVTRGRKEEIVALGVTDDYSTVNFQRLAIAFIEDAQASKRVTVEMSAKVQAITPENNGFRVHTATGDLRARFVVVSAGGHSLLFAQQMGYGLQYACLPVAGSFYYTPTVLNGKVYTVQNEKLPFAAIHGDPDVLMPGKTRFGPTALILPMLERYHYNTIPDFLRVFSLDAPVMKVMYDLFKERDVRRYMAKNVLFEIPGIRRMLFLQDARKIIPQMQLKDLKFAHGIGGVRPVMIDKINRKLHMGEAKIAPGNGIIFNMTPSPGATSCLQNAARDMHSVVQHLGARFDEAAYKKTLG
ncbi:MAG: FAD-dependent oxidoreductase [Gammaproteobacteria bacterium]|nr:FAD-dependent oxidoreductase [Gammaproteobacteria bacterium]